MFRIITEIRSLSSLSTHENHLTNRDPEYRGTISKRGRTWTLKGKYLNRDQREGKKYLIKWVSAVKLDKQLSKILVARFILGWFKVSARVQMSNTLH